MIGKPRIALTSLLGLILASLGLSYLINLERIQRRTLEWLMVLQPNSMLTNLWENPSLGIIVNLYIFNWTNSEDYNNPNVKPRFEELGPYTFSEKMRKQNITWNNENSTVSYYRKSRFNFIESESVGKLSDRIITPNIINVGIPHKATMWNPMLRTVMLFALKIYGTEPTFHHTADEWLFGGFDTPLLKMSKLVPSQLLPEIHFPYERLGYGYPRNGSTEVYGYHNVYTGRDDFRKVGQIARWRNNNVSSAFPHCELHGSTGEFHPIPLIKGRSISYFLPDLCRELKMEYEGTTTFEGVHAYVYKGTAKTMANSTDNPENSCYCKENCKDVRSGLLNVSSCWYDVPVFASFPHFYNADPYYVDAVEGMKPDKDRHEMVVILEPKTGMLLDLKARIMASLLIEPRPESVFNRNRPAFFPLVWADYKVRISPDFLFYLKLLPISELIGKICGYLVVVLGLALLLYYPKQIYMERRFMRSIDITNIENRMQSTVVNPELKNPTAEASPLLVGLQYMAISPVENIG